MFLGMMRLRGYLRVLIRMLSRVYEKITRQKFGRTTDKGDPGEIFANEVLTAMGIEVEPSTVRAFPPAGTPVPERPLRPIWGWVGKPG